MKQTTLHQKHLRLKAKMTEFQGWLVPLRYDEAQDEYHAVRSAAGLFDVSYLGRLEVNGAGAATLLQKVFTRNILKIPDNTVQYGLFCDESGHVLDDGLVFHVGNGRYVITTNAVSTEKILLWLGNNATPDVNVADKTQTTAQFALQGPQSSRILEKLSGTSYKKIRSRTFRNMIIADTAVLVSRTGYTGEHGYEFFLPADRAEVVWDAVMDAGSDAGLLPAGLACRDLLRLEMGYLRYGSDLDETHNPLEAGLEAFIDFKKDFIGKEALLKIGNEGPKQKLAGFILLDKGAPKIGGSIFSENREIGLVTSGCLSPHLRKGIGLGYVISRYSQAGQEIEIEVKDREIAAKIVDLPFYKKK
jgi:aminomethyltransferase